MPRDFERGLGAVPSPPDARDFQLAVPVTVAFPARFTLSGLGPVLDQGTYGTCVANAADGIRMWQERRDLSPISTWVTQPGAVWPLYDACKALDGFPDPLRQYGTSLRTVLKVLRSSVGTPLATPKHQGGRIAAYYAVTPDVAHMKAALMAHGPLLVALDWDSNWFYVPTSLILKAPTGHVAGGHAFYLWGWDDAVNGGCWLMRNSWGRGSGGWTATGNAYMRFGYFANANPEAWWVADILGDPIT